MVDQEIIKLALRFVDVTFPLDAAINMGSPTWCDNVILAIRSQILGDHVKQAQHTQSNKPFPSKVPSQWDLRRVMGTKASMG